MRTKRFDFSGFSPASVSRTPSGGVILPARLTRVGVFPYRTPSGGVIREYRPPSEVFAPESVAGLNGATVTVDHPPDMVTPDTWDEVSVGHIVERSVTPDETQKFLESRVALESATCIRRVDSGELVEISCGYSCDIDETPGVTDTGEQYDRVQRNIRYNHVALGPRGWGRAGPEVCLRLDSFGDMVHHSVVVAQPHWSITQMKHTISRNKSVLRVDGVEYPLNKPEGRTQARAALKAVVESNKATLENIRKDSDPQALGDLRKTLELALSQVDQMATALVPEEAMDAEAPAEEKPPVTQADSEAMAAEQEKKTDSLVAAKFAVVAKAKSLAPSIQWEGKSVPQIMREALQVSGYRVDGLSEQELRGAFAVATPKTNTLQELANATSGVPGVTRGDSEETPEQAYNRALQNHWKKQKK